MPLSSKDMILLLLSSVLVSSNPIATSPQKVAFRSREDGEEERELEAREPVETTQKGELGATSSQTLGSRWTLWYEKKSEARKPKCLNKSDYLKELKKAATFETIPEFLSSWNNVEEICRVSAVEGGVNFHLFKENIKPVWEDQRNIKGGKWSFLLPSSTPLQEVMKHWMSLMLTILIEELGAHSEINGVVLSVRAWGSMFSVWNRNCNDKQLVDAVTIKLKELFGVSTIKYERHQLRVKRNNTERAKMARAKRHYSSDESISSSSASSSDGEQERPFRGRWNKGSRSAPGSRRSSLELGETEGRVYSVVKLNQALALQRVETKEPEDMSAFAQSNVIQRTERVRATSLEDKKGKRRVSVELKDNSVFPFNALGMVFMMVLVMITSSFSWFSYLKMN
jgi:translation initiation factor 4E